MKVLIACEYSGRVRDAFLKKGHDAISCDLLETDSSGPHYKGDVFDIVNDGFDLMIAHPPCTRLANSGVRWLKNPPNGRTLYDMWTDLFAAAEFYNKLRSVKIKKKCIENPIFHKYAKALIPKAERQIVQPWFFGDESFKATGFELYNLPNLTDTHRLTPPSPGTEEHKKWSAVHRAPPSPDRWKLRSTTHYGVADAMAEQWGRLSG